MSTYKVTTYRKETRWYLVAADSAEQAEELALSGYELPDRVNREDEYLLVATKLERP